jgi:hypothetical protein
VDGIYRQKNGREKMAKTETDANRADRLEAALVEVYGIADEADGSRQAMQAALDELQTVVTDAVPDAADQWANQSTAAPEDEDEDEDDE